MISSTVTHYFNCEGRIALEICEAYSGKKSGTASRINASIGILFISKKENEENNYFCVGREQVSLTAANS